MPLMAQRRIDILLAFFSFPFCCIIHSVGLKSLLHPLFSHMLITYFSAFYLPSSLHTAIHSPHLHHHTSFFLNLYLWDPIMDGIIQIPCAMRTSTAGHVCCSESLLVLDPAFPILHFALSFFHCCVVYYICGLAKCVRDIHS